MVQVKTKPKAFTLPNEVVMVEFIKKQKGNITNPKHVLYGGMSESAKRKLVPKKSPVTYRYISILSKEEQEFLEGELQLPEGGLSIHLSSNNYWDTVAVFLKKEGLSLDLSDPIQYIHYKVVMSYTNLIAPSLAEQKRINKATYMFVIVRKGEKSNAKVSTYSLKRDAYKIADKLEVHTDKIKEFLYLSGVRISPNADVTWLRAKLADMVETNPEAVVKLGSSTDYTVRALIAKGVLSGVIKDLGGRYQLEDGIELAHEGNMPTLANAIDFLNDPKNSEVKLRIESKIGE